MNPKQAIDKLVAGNERFRSGMRSVDSLLAHSKMEDLAKHGQKPFAIILTCSDSRSPVELIFDQGVGELFVVRVAGNVVAPSLLASIEFAVANFGSSAILVLGHTLCGAVKATCEHTRNPSVALPSPHLEELVGRIRPAVEATQRETPVTDPGFVEKCAIANVQRSMRLIVEQSQIVRDAIAKEQVSVKGAILELPTGAVKLL